MTGKKIGRLTVIREKPIEEYLNEKRRCVQWYCNCDCGAQDILVDGIQLRRNHVVSCGCFNREMSIIKNSSDILGLKFGELTVSAKTSKPENSSKKGSWWLCKCSCGNRLIVHSNALKTGNTTSCGCVNSKGEKEINRVLSSMDINYSTQYTFNDCRSEITNRLLKFDFAVFDAEGVLNFLIEYDGEQHYNCSRFSPYSSVNEEKFRRTKLYDMQKDNYCKSHNIDILRIPYWDYENISDIITKKLEGKGVI